jgi:hypothetical protein
LVRQRELALDLTSPGERGRRQLGGPVRLDVEQLGQPDLPAVGGSDPHPVVQ